jgi:poly-gamma-glutamate capsule biosynthesis protein CapA/YwtB (metallophosphatase superfamily)
LGPAWSVFAPIAFAFYFFGQTPMLFRIFLHIALLFIFGAFGPAAQAWVPPVSPEQVPTDSLLQVQEEPAPPRLRLTFVGDISCHPSQYDQALTEDGHDFGPHFEWVAPYLKQADLAIGNLQTTFAGTESEGRSAGYGHYNAPDAFASALAHAGFDLLYLANAHSLDYGEAGLKRTREVLSQNGLQTAGLRHLHRQESPATFLEAKGMRIAVLAYTAHSNASLESPDSLSLHRLDPTALPRHIALARNEGAELVIVHFHYGQAYQQRPTALQLEAVKAAARSGADLIVGDHPLVLQPMNTFKSGQSYIDHTLVAYSLGNFLTHQQGRHTRAGMMLTIEIERQDKDKPLRIAKVEAVPTAVLTPEEGLTAILPTHIAAEPTPLPYLAHAAREKLKISDYHLRIMRQAERDTREMIRLRDLPVTWERGY